MTLQYSEISTDNEISKQLNTNNNKNHNKTIKKNSDINMSQLFEKIHKTSKVEEIKEDIGNNSNTLGDFKPIDSVNPVQNIKYTPELLNKKNIQLEENINNYNETYYASVPYNTQQTNNNYELLKKLNHILTILEEDRDEKTNNVVEEVILYAFLGIFIIFIIDSFARASKYVR